MSFRPSGHILRLLGSITLVFTTSTTIFFVLYSISTFSAHSVLSPSCTAAAVFNIAICILLLLFTIFPSRKRLHLLGGIISTVFAGIISTLALGWMSFHPTAMPNTMFGRDRDPLVIAGFSLFVVSLVFQAIFWTLQIFTCPRPCDRIGELGSTPAEVVEKPFPSLNFTPTNFSSTTLDVEKHSTFILRPAPTQTKLHNSTILYVTETPPVIEPAVEMDPFDTWDTSGVGATQRAACTLAAIECEQNMDVAIGLGIFTPANSIVVGSDIGKEAGKTSMEEVVDDVQIHVSLVERQNSPPIPDYDMTPRSASFPVGIFPMSSMGRIPALVVSPIGESRAFDEGSGRLVNTRSPRGDLGTGKWLVRSQTMV